MLLLAGCPTEVPPAPPDVEDPGTLSWGEEIACAAPVNGLEGLVEMTGWSGLDQLPLGPVPPWGFISVVLAHDVDGDGDVDLVKGSVGAPRLALNDGTGRFEDAGDAWDPSIAPSGEPAPMQLADLDGDGLPELLTYDVGFLLVARNLGGGVFAEPDITELRPEPDKWPLSIALSLGDADGDGDLDVAMGTDFSFDAPPSGPIGSIDMAPAPDLLLRNDDGVFVLDQLLRTTTGNARGLMAMWTDRDLDGDLDLLFGSDRGGTSPPTAFYRNDGDLRFEDDAPDQHVNLPLSVMGGDARDLNEDGLLDYCVSDVGPLVCWLSDDAGYIESGTAMGLEPSHADNPAVWSGWGLEFADLDLDGRDDLVGTGAIPGPPEGGSNPDDPALLEHPDAIWQATDDGYALVPGLFDSPDDHWSVASADFDGDGALELVTAGASSGLSYWDNRCTGRAWVAVELVGPPVNSEAYGARVQVEAAGRTWLQELHGTRTAGQSWSRLHFGLGDVDVIDVLTVTWPDGGELVVTDVPVRRFLTAVHPEGIAQAR